jgi:hypothetical protein
MAKGVLLALLVGVGAACTAGAPAGFTLKGATVDTSYTCPAGAVDAFYTVHGVIDVTNGTSQSVSVKSVTAVMTLAALKGPWLEKVGDRYEPAGVMSFSSFKSIGPGSSGSLQVIVPSACTRGTVPSPEQSYGDYAVAFTVITSSGTYRIQSSNRHRIVAN